MRQTFDKSTPRAEQLIRVAQAKQVGRKHNHKASRRIEDRRAAGKSAHQKVIDRRIKQWKIRVAAYFRGELDELPAGPFS